MKKLFAVFVSMMFAAVAQAVDIHPLETEDGLNAYFVESPSLPMISVSVSFRAGEAFAPEGQTGLASLTAGLLSQGAGKYNSEAFTQEVQRIGARLGASANGLNFSVHLTTLTQHKQRAFELLKLALQNPRFEQADFERLQNNSVMALRRAGQQPSHVVRENFDRFFYGDHPYGRFATVKSVENLTLKDVRAYYAKHLNRANMVVSVVGDVSKEELSQLLDDTLADLPKGISRNKIEQLPPRPEARLVRVQRDMPQTHVLMGHSGIGRHDPDYFAAFTMNYILGGGGFNSRLMKEVREKRGLAYSVYSYFEMLPHYGRFMAGVQTKTADADTSIALMKGEMARMRVGEVSAEEVENAKRFLKGSFPLRINSNRKILGYLTVMQMENLGADYLDMWTSHIDTLTLGDIKRVAARLLQPENLVVVRVGG